MKSSISIRHIEWLWEQLLQSEAGIAEAETVLAQEKENAAHLKKMLKLIDQTLQQEPTNESVSEGESEPNIESIEKRSYSASSFGKNSKEVFSQVELPDNKRSPKGMLFPEYANMSLSEAIYKFLRQVSSTPLNLEEITRAMFDIETEDEFIRAKNSLAAEIRRNEKLGKWKNVGNARWQVVDNSSKAPLETLEGWRPENNKHAVLDGVS